MTLTGQNSPNFDFENQYNGLTAGVDEAGCGPWAGPVVAAAVVIDQSSFPKRFFLEINDSKKLSKKKREAIYSELIQHSCLKHHVGISTVEEIDNLNIWRATQLAMFRALKGLIPQPAYVLIDGAKKPTLDYPMQVIVKGDQKSFSIAAASIIAKVKRDEIMSHLHQQYPFFGWHKNAGYGTDEHQGALKQHGVTPHHRKSFAPIRSLISKDV
jgi:ribonuclease HII